MPKCPRWARWCNWARLEVRTVLACGSFSLSAVLMYLYFINDWCSCSQAMKHNHIIYQMNVCWFLTEMSTTFLCAGAQNEKLMKELIESSQRKVRTSWCTTAAWSLQCRFQCKQCSQEELGRHLPDKTVSWMCGWAWVQVQNWCYQAHKKCAVTCWLDKAKTKWLQENAHAVPTCAFLVNTHTWQVSPSMHSFQFAQILMEARSSERF